VGRRGLALWIITALAVLLLAAPGSAKAASPSGATAKLADCSGLATYQKQMLTVGKRWVKGMQRDGLLGRSTQTFDEADWQAYGKRAERLANDLDKIKAPGAVASWHEALIRSTHLKMDIAGVVPLLGFDTTIQIFGKRVSRTIDALTSGRETATAACSEFAGFNRSWDALDGNDYVKSSTGTTPSA
jgi:hypothetical protein